MNSRTNSKKPGQGRTRYSCRHSSPLKQDARGEHGTGAEGTGEWPHTITHHGKGNCASRATRTATNGHGGKGARSHQGTHHSKDERAKTKPTSISPSPHSTTKASPQIKAGSELNPPSGRRGQRVKKTRRRTPARRARTPSRPHGPPRMREIEPRNRPERRLTPRTGPERSRRTKARRKKVIGPPPTAPPSPPRWNRLGTRKGFKGQRIGRKAKRRRSSKPRQHKTKRK